MTPFVANPEAAPAPATRRARPRRRRRPYTLLTGLIDLFGVPVAVLSAAAFFGALDWRVDLLSHFRLQYAVVLLAVGVAAAVTRRWSRTVLFAAAWGANAWLLAPAWLPPPGAAPAADAPELKVVVANVLTSNRRHDAVFAAIDAQDADVVVLLEVNQRWLVEATRLTRYRLLASDPREDNFGVAVFLAGFSEWGGEARLLWMPPDQLPAVELDVRRPDGAAWSLLAIHPLPPTSKANVASRDETLDAAAAWMANHPGRPKLLVGDLNTTPWSAAMRELLDETGLVDSARGHGVSPTWPDHGFGPYALNAFNMIPIDHLLHTPDLVTIDRYTIGNVGSDHRFVVATVAAGPE